MFGREGLAVFVLGTELLAEAVEQDRLLRGVIELGHVALDPVLHALLDSENLIELGHNRLLGL